MSRQTQIPLLKWRQGAGKNSISQATWAMNPMLPKTTRFASLNSLQWINRLGAGSVAIFWALGASVTQPAQASASESRSSGTQEFRSRSLAASLTEEFWTPKQSEVLVQEHEAFPGVQIQEVEQSAVDRMQEATIAQPLPTKVLATASTQRPVLKERSHKSLELRTTQKIDDGEAVPQSQSNLRSQIPDTHSVVPDYTHRQLREQHAHPPVAQLPLVPQSSAPLPVPATPIPANSKRTNSSTRQIPSLPQPPNPIPATEFQASPNFYTPTVGQLPSLPQPQYSMPATGFPAMGQSPYYPQAVILVPVPATGFPAMGQSPYYPQAVILVPVPATGFPAIGQSPYYPQAVSPQPAPLNPNATGFNNYNPSQGQSAYYPQPPAPSLPVVPIMIPVGGGGYNPSMGQTPYYPQTMPSLPIPVNPGAVGSTNYNPGLAQPGYYPQAVPSLPAPVNPGAVGSTYNPALGQSAYYPQAVPPLPPPVNPGAVGSTYNPALGQSAYYPQAVPPLPAPVNPGAVGTNTYYPALGQPPYSPQNSPPLPIPPNPNLTPPLPTPTPQSEATPPTQQPTLERDRALTNPYLRLQGVYILQGDQSSARARLYGLYPLTSRVQFGGSVDLITGEDVFADSRGEGLNINELYVATAPFESLPNLRLVAGQLDLTSYFDRNSFAKDGASQFFNPVFQTNPALSATGLASRQGVLVNWTVTDNIEAKAAVFSSARDIGDFALNGFAGEIGIRYGNAIIRGTYASDRDAGSRDAFREIFGVQRGDGGTGIRSSDREQAYGVNFEYFFPDINMGVFGRYGRYDNRTLGRGGDTYSAGISFLDVFAPNDRLGIAYGRALSNDLLRRQRGDDVPDVLELFYDFRFLPNLRLGFTLQQRDGFSETYGGFRVKTEFDLLREGD